MLLSRRQALTLGAAVAGGGLSAMLGGCSGGLDLPGGIDVPGGPRPRSTPVPASSLPQRATVAGARLVYEPTRRAAPLRIEPGFAGRLDAWLTDLQARLGANPVATLWGYGAWTPDDGDPSWHHAGRALDISSLRDGAGAVIVSARHDLWRAESAASVARRERAYWRLAASLHKHFDHVLTYLYDQAHRNHLHVDDGRSGADQSDFWRGSRVQVQAVQAMLTHVWGRGTPTTGDFDGATADACREVLDGLGVGGSLTDGRRQWQAFLNATTARA